MNSTYLRSLVREFLCDHNFSGISRMIYYDKIYLNKYIRGDYDSGNN
ncbi:hypothetical protein MHK_007534 [Candidatus Magnetomorum sp. HK-1]|nr:hypothetical protein MHK_007534 [Candidatus Magnetomorum sp. HK-1]